MQARHPGRIEKDGGGIFRAGGGPRVGVAQPAAALLGQRKA